MRRLKRKILRGTAAGVALAAAIAVGAPMCTTAVNVLAQEPETTASESTESTENTDNTDSTASSSEESNQTASEAPTDEKDNAKENKKDESYDSSDDSKGDSDASSEVIKKSDSAASEDAAAAEVAGKTDKAAATYEDNVKAALSNDEGTNTANETFTVTFANNGQGNVPDALQIKSGETLAKSVGYDARKLRPEVTVIQGYRFDDSGSSWGIYSDAACENEFDIFNTPITADTTLYVKWVPVQTHTVKFDAGGVTDNPGSIIVADGVYLGGYKLPFDYSELINGYRFYGWGYNYEKINSDITLHARWEKCYKVSFDMNGHGEAQEPVYTIGEKVYDLDLPEDISSGDGYVLTGWYKDRACTNLFSKSDDITSDITLYAGWKKVTKEQHKISFENNGHGAAVADRYVEDGGKINIYNLKPEEDGYRFIGWYLEPEFINYVDGYIDDIHKDTTLYAAWVKNDEKITLTFDNNGHGIAPKSVFVNPGGPIEYYLPILEDVKDYYFDGWSYDKEGENRTPTYIWQGHSIEPLVKDTTVYAIWKPINYYLRKR